MNYPIEPHLEFEDIKIISGLDILGYPLNYLNLFLKYTDGDANLGRKYIMDQPNCTITFYKKINFRYSLILDPPFNNPLYLNIGEIPQSKNTYEMGPITIIAKTIYDGEMKIKLPIIPSNFYKLGDTIKISVQIKDNVNNNSNLAEKEFVYPL